MAGNFRICIFAKGVFIFICLKSTDNPAAKEFEAVQHMHTVWNFIANRIAYTGLHYSMHQSTVCTNFLPNMNIMYNPKKIRVSCFLAFETFTNAYFSYACQYICNYVYMNLWLEINAHEMNLSSRWKCFLFRSINFVIFQSWFKHPCLFK